MPDICHAADAHVLLPFPQTRSLYLDGKAPQLHPVVATGWRRARDMIGVEPGDQWIVMDDPSPADIVQVVKLVKFLAKTK